MSVLISPDPVTKISLVTPSSPAQLTVPSQLHSFTLLVLCTTHGTTHPHQPFITLIYPLSKFDRSYSGAVGRPSCSEALDIPPQIIPRRTVIMRPRCPGHSRTPTIDLRASINLPSKPTVTVSNGQGLVCLTWDKIGHNRHLSPLDDMAPAE